MTIVTFNASTIAPIHPHSKMSNPIFTGIVQNSASVFRNSAELITSGFAHLFTKDFLKINIQNLSFVINFREDGNSDFKIETNASENELTLTLVNASNPIGQGIAEPIEVGHIGARKITMTLMCITLNPESKARKIEYAFYLEPADE